MKSVEDAQSLVLTTTPRLPRVSCPLQQAAGLILAEDVASDLDMPPYDKSLVDGFAVRAEDVKNGQACLTIVGQIFAGETPAEKSISLSADQSARIMTGAPIPPGADSVVMIEQTEESAGDSNSSAPAAARKLPGSVFIRDPRFKPGQNIMRRGREMTCGQVVLNAGVRIRASEVGLLASVGRADVPVHRRPRVAILSTGNEIVEAHEKPGPGKIRNSNAPLLEALVSRAGAMPEYLGIATDSVGDLAERIQIGLRADLLILSGGVSAGDLDLVPGVLRDLGVREVFHKVNLKPGKPVWFGVVKQISRESDGTEQRVGVRGELTRSATHDQPGQTVVFGLPGNPVSVMACFELFVRPAIRQLMGYADPVPAPVMARLAEEKAIRSDRPTYWPGRLEYIAAELRAFPLVWHGSPDLRAMTDANALICFSAGERVYRTGDLVGVLMLEY